MQTELLGYLLNALDEEETRRVKQLLAADETARQQLEVLRYSLLPLGSSKSLDEPPTDLAARTCIFISETRRTQSL